tara:strand:+ start:136 stop:384 length:249 start_codon:yes stop_codon:yes gene_type:complete
MAVKILDSMWFIPLGSSCFGIVLTENTVGEKKFYIGPTLTDVNQKIDEIYISELGAKVDPITVIKFLMKGVDDEMSTLFKRS